MLLEQKLANQEETANIFKSSKEIRRTFYAKKDNTRNNQIFQQQNSYQMSKDRKSAQNRKQSELLHQTPFQNESHSRDEYTMKTPKISKTKDNISQMTHQQVMKSMNSHQIIKSMSSKNILPSSQENIKRNRQVLSRNENGSLYVINKNRTNKSDLNLVDNKIITIDDQEKTYDE